MTRRCPDCLNCRRPFQPYMPWVSEMLRVADLGGVPTIRNHDYANEAKRMQRLDVVCATVEEFSCCVGVSVVVEIEAGGLYVVRPDGG